MANMVQAIRMALHYGEKHLGADAKHNSLTLLFAGEPRDGAIEIRQDAKSDQTDGYVLPDR